MKKYSLFNFLFLIAIVGCLDRPSELIGHGEFRSAKTQKSYDFLSFGDLDWDWTTHRPSKEDTSIYLCVPAISTVQYEKLGCWYEADENLSSPCHSIAGDYLLIITPEGYFDVYLFTPSKLDDQFSELQSQHFDIVPIECIVNDGKQAISKNPKIEHLRVLALNEASQWEMVTSREIVSRREMAFDLVQMGYQIAFVLESGTLDAGWYRYANTTFDIGRHPKSAPFQTNWLIARLPQD